MQTKPLDKTDYDFIVSVIDQWWEGPTSALAHPIYFYELGGLARIVTTQSGERVGFLFGFVADGAEGKLGYVHLIGIHPEFRRRGVARLLYAAFEGACRTAGCARLKAITTAGNEGSIEFHRALGWTVREVEGYAGPGRTRFVFEKSLAD